MVSGIQWGPRMFSRAVAETGRTLEQATFPAALRCKDERKRFLLKALSTMTATKYRWFL